jgi:signal transduction histidine kinase/CheY-like chemotaxis protein
MGTSRTAQRQHEDLADLRGQALQTISLFILPIGVVWLWLVIWPAFGQGAPVAAWVGCAILTLTATIAYMANPWQQPVASWLLLVGILTSICCALLTFRIPDLAHLFVLAVVLASVLVSEKGLLSIALVSSGLSICIANRYMGLSPWDREVVVPVSVIVLSSAASWITARNLYTALDWAWHSYHQAVRDREQARSRRAELRRTLHALDEATSRLQRTNQELLNARREADEARVLKEQFVANVSHELRTPLNIIVGFAEMMYLVPETYGGVTWTPDLESDIREMYKASQHLQSLINDVLDLSRIDAARLPMFREVTDVRSVVRDAIEIVSPLLRQRGLGCETDCPETLPQVLVDRTRIRQVMLNLLNNAARFTDSGGITVRVRQDREAVVVSVEDTGVGIPTEQLGTIFGLFGAADGSSTRRGGVGLGLALSRQFVEVHGGTMWAESSVGVGSRFHFTLPLPGTTLRPASLQRIPHRASLALSRSPVVVMDPDPAAAEMLGRYLGDHRILVAGNETEAEQLVETAHPLAVIVNQQPIGPPEAWLRCPGPVSARYNVPVLHCSIPSPSWLKQSTQVNECLTKPLTRETLNRMLRRYCREPSTILLVDDDPGFVSLVARMLKTMPLAAEVMTAYSGGQALRLAKARVPQLVLLDLLMPDMDGFEVLELMRQDAALANTRFLVVTATSYAEEALARQEGYLTLIQAKGIPTGTVIELLNATLALVRPDYVGDESTV